MRLMRSKFWLPSLGLSNGWAPLRPNPPTSFSVSTRFYCFSFVLILAPRLAGPPPLGQATVTVAVQWVSIYPGGICWHCANSLITAPLLGKEPTQPGSWLGACRKPDADAGVRGLLVFDTAKRPLVDIPYPSHCSRSTSIELGLQSNGRSSP